MSLIYQRCSGIFFAHFVRDFKNDDIIHVNGKIDPEEDVATINLELILADLETVSKRLGPLEKQTKASKDKDLLKNVEILQNLKKILKYLYR